MPGGQRPALAKIQVDSEACITGERTGAPERVRGRRHVRHDRGAREHSSFDRALYAIGDRDRLPEIIRMNDHRESVAAGPSARPTIEGG